MIDDSDCSDIQYYFPDKVEMKITLLAYQNVNIYVFLKQKKNTS